MTAEEVGNSFHIRFKFKPDILRQIKAISGARWVPSQSMWSVPSYQRARVQALIERYGEAAEIDDVPEQVGDMAEMPDPSQEIIDFCNANLKLQPYTYQMQGIERGSQLKKFINGDEPGLGKTIQSIATVLHTNAFPCLVICPTTLKENWRREWSEKFTTKKSLILTDKIKNTWPAYLNHKMCDVMIVNYESLKKYFVESIDIPKGQKLRLTHIKLKEQVGLFKSVIIDECHKLKDGTTQQSKFSMLLAQGKEVAIGLTGTPYVNKVQDLIPQLLTIGKLNDFGGYKLFNARYCSGYSGASNLKELNYKLHQICFFRRLKADVLKDLPDRIRQVVHSDISTRAEYDQAKNDFVKFLKENKGNTDKEIRKKLRAEFIVKLQLLKGISAKGKLEDVFEWTDEIIDAGKKVVLFCQLRDIGDAVIARYKDLCVEIRGGISNEERQASIDRFQRCGQCGINHENHSNADHPYVNNDVKVILCGIKAAGVGVTLTAASDVGFIEFPWTDADCDQCESRCHRNGQKNSVRAAYFLGDKTVDQYCYDIIKNKRNISDQIAGQTVVDEEVIDNMINLFS